MHLLQWQHCAYHSEFQVNFKCNHITRLLGSNLHRYNSFTAQTFDWLILRAETRRRAVSMNI